MMMKNGQVEEYIEGAPIHQHALVALLVFALDVIFVASPIATARLASTSQGMQKLDRLVSAPTTDIIPFWMPSMLIITLFCFPSLY